MPIFTVDVACRATGFDYTALMSALRNARAQPVMDARWLIDVGQDLNEVTAALLSHCAPGDGLFVIELAPETRWSGTGLGDDAKAWFAERTKRSELPAEVPIVAAKLN